MGYTQEVRPTNSFGIDTVEGDVWWHAADRVTAESADHGAERRTMGWLICAGAVAGIDQGGLWPSVYSRKLMLRITDILSAMVASRGINSQISSPRTFVWMGRNSPRNSAGASGFISTGLIHPPVQFQGEVIGAR